MIRKVLQYQVVVGAAERADEFLKGENILYTFIEFPSIRARVEGRADRRRIE